MFGMIGVNEDAVRRLTLNDITVLGIQPGYFSDSINYQYVHFYRTYEPLATALRYYFSPRKRIPFPVSCVNAENRKVARCAHANHFTALARLKRYPDERRFYLLRIRPGVSYPGYIIATLSQLIIWVHNIYVPTFSRRKFDLFFTNNHSSSPAHFIIHNKKDSIIFF